MNYISLFTGIGGFDIALDRQGFNCVMQVEKDEQATNVLRRHWSPVPKHDDVTTFSKDMISEPVDIICGGFPCFVAGTLILTQSGYVPIEDVTIGDLVLTHNLRFKKVIQVMKRESNETVCLSGVGGKITTTSEHPFFSVVSKRNWSAGSNGKNTFSTPLWIKAQDMVGRYWLSPCVFPTIDMPNFDIKEREKIPCNFTEDFFWFLGLWLGDGWLKSTKRKESKKTRNTNYNQVFICSNKGSEDYVLSKILAAGLKTTLVKDKTTTKFIVSSSPLYRWIKENFSFGARNKTVPYWLVSVCSEYRKAFLDGYFFADGHKYSSSRKATTVSKKVAYGVQMIAYSLGYSSSVFAYNVPPRTVIEGREVNQCGQYQVAVYEKTKRTFRDGYVYGLVRKAENAGTNIVYNIGVEDDESYVADGFVVHNCQDLSVAGKREGLAGERSGLWYQFHRIIFDVKPRYAIIENVPGLLSSGRSKGLDFAIILAGLTGRIPQIPDGGWRNSGFMRGRRGFYNIAWRVLDAQYFGVPQRRRRVFIVASLGNGRCAQILLNTESLSGDIAESKSKGTDIAGCLRKSIGESGADDNAAQANHLVVGSVIAHQYKTGGISNHDVKSGHVVVAPEKAKALTTKATRQDYETETFVFESRIARNGRGAPDTVAPVLKSDSNGDGAPLVFQFQASPSQSMNPSAVSPSLDKSKQPATYQQGSGVRRLTPVEHERLQGFPDGWTAQGVDKSGEVIEISDSQRYKQTGNAVAVPVVEWIAQRLKKEMEEESASSISNE